MTLVKKHHQQHQQQNNTHTLPPPPPHVIVLPFPFQGHINPALQFSKLLVSKGLQVTLVISLLDDHTTAPSDLTQSHLSSVTVHFLSAPELDQHEPPPTGFAILDKFETTVRTNLPIFVSKMRETTGQHPACLVYDSVIPWALDMAREDLKVMAASFFTMPCAVGAIFCNYYEGKIEVPKNKEEEKVVCVEGMEEVVLEIEDLPSYIYDDVDVNAPRSLRLLSDQFSNVGDADWIFCNTFTSLEQKTLDWMGSKFKFKPIGPTIPSIYLGKQLELEGDDHHQYGISLFKPQSQTTLLKWLDTQLAHSVIYVSFGSVASLSDEQTAEVAAALQNINRPFLWVVRKSEQDKLPPNFITETSDRGLVVSWCCQPEVLAHKSTGCFVTHCGWNSTIEALSLGVPMVAVPQFADQPTNAKFVEDVWKVGVRVRRDRKEGGIVWREELGIGIMEVMEGARAKGIRKNADKWRNHARAAVADGGSSDDNIQEFVDQLTNSQLLQGLKL